MKFGVRHPLNKLDTCRELWSLQLGFEDGMVSSVVLDGVTPIPDGTSGEGRAHNFSRDARKAGAFFSFDEEWLERSAVTWEMGDPDYAKECRKQARFVARLRNDDDPLRGRLVAGSMRLNRTVGLVGGADPEDLGQQKGNSPMASDAAGRTFPLIGPGTPDGPPPGIMWPTHCHAKSYG